MLFLLPAGHPFDGVALLLYGRRQVVVLEVESSVSDARCFEIGVASMRLPGSNLQAPLHSLPCDTYYFQPTIGTCNCKGRVP